ncbi:MAG: L,D-transpeptidase family protein [Deltaproteobacteria bacterium]|nr:L,D-transpeptidase family protein [Deltaproteobacteria bacterium]
MAASETEAAAEPKPPGTLEEEAAKKGVAWPPPEVHLLVDKSDRRLWVYSGEIDLKVYRVGLGGTPEGDKVRQGDQRTPVGRFTVVTRNDRSHYHLFLGLSYPDAEDAERGLKEGLINTAEAAAIQAAAGTGAKPPWNTTLGGAIGIHGNGSGWDWTLGCVAVEDHEIEEIWAIAPHGTPVEIRG